MNSTARTTRFAAALSTAADSGAAADEVCRKALASVRVKGAAFRADLAFLFVSSHHRNNLAAMADQICSAIGSENLFGCTGESIIGGAREIEDGPAVSLWFASLPGTDVKTMHLDFVQTHEGATFTGWPTDLSEPWPKGAAMILLGEPFSFPADELVRRFNEDRPGVSVHGGMASGGHAPGENLVVLGREVHRQGAVAAIISGGVKVRSVVSQGCRPIGKPFVVTKAERNIIYELGGVPPLVRLQEIFRTISDEERQLVQRGLHVGRVLSEYQDEFAHGDFLVRNVIGADPRTGEIAIGDFVRPGQTVQFHVRDEQTADDDLRKLLKIAVASSRSHPSPTAGADDSAKQAAAPSIERAALLFTCNGRGTRMFSTADHDAACVQSELGEIPAAGFFAQGEIGPVAGKNFLHGFTASIALFEAD